MYFFNPITAVKNKKYQITFILTVTNPLINAATVMPAITKSNIYPKVIHL
jgi:hypothetical protein